MVLEGQHHRVLGRFEGTLRDGFDDFLPGRGGGGEGAAIEHGDRFKQSAHSFYCFLPFLLHFIGLHAVL